MMMMMIMKKKKKRAMKVVAANVQEVSQIYDVISKASVLTSTWSTHWRCNWRFSRCQSLLFYCQFSRHSDKPLGRA